MANQELLDLLLQDVNAWNAWRKRYPETRPYLSEADLSDTNLSGANLYRANLIRANLYRANLIRASLIRANLSYADLSEADLSGANLSGATLDGADLSDANLSDASLSDANLFRADLSRADLSDANLSNARVGWTIFGNVDLRMVKGLETVSHSGPSTIGTNTLLRSQGDIPEKFLREAGLTDTFITYVRSLVQNPIEYYTCFISYSSKDQEFVESLYADLQAKGVRCWFAPESMKIGDKIRQRIDESIRLYDKLLLVLSEQSVKSAWVEYEVEAALAKERREGRTVLFPLRLDITVMESHTDWADHIHETRHIGDFTCWKDHDAYQKGLKRLLRDLQPDHPPTSQS